VTENTSLTDYVSGITELVSLSTTSQKITEVIQDPKTDHKILEELVQLDPSLTAILLRVINSAFYGFNQPITSISHAISFIGKFDLQNIVITTATVESLETLSNKFIELSEFWHHSIFTGLIAKHLSVAKGLGDKESFFTGGLLHDIGKLIICNQSPDVSQQLIDNTEGDQQWLALEQQLLGFTHADVGAELARSWGLPALYCDCIHYHHDLAAETEFEQHKIIIHTANQLANHIDRPESDLSLPEFCQQLSEQTPIALEAEKIIAAVDNASAQSFEVMEAIYPGCSTIY
jgi:putative nucleotidyltransferase with HDIG domain